MPGQINGERKVFLINVQSTKHPHLKKNQSLLSHTKINAKCET